MSPAPSPNPLPDPPSPLPDPPPPWRRQGGQGRIDDITRKGLRTAIALSTASCSRLVKFPHGLAKICQHNMPVPPKKFFWTADGKRGCKVLGNATERNYHARETLHVELRTEHVEVGVRVDVAVVVGRVALHDGRVLLGHVEPRDLVLLHDSPRVRLHLCNVSQSTPCLHVARTRDLVTCWTYVAG